MYHRRPTEPRTITYQRRGTCALDQFEELMEDDFDFQEGPQNRTYQRRLRYQRNRREYTDENDFMDQFPRNHNKGQGNLN